MKLFRKDGYDLLISEEAYALKVFRTLWDRDKSKDKDRAKLELGFVYFMEDSLSDYRYIIDADTREEEIKLGEGFRSNWKPDKYVRDAQEFYASFKTTSEELLDVSRELIDKYKTKLRSIDMDDMDVKELKEVGGILKVLPDVIADFDKAEKAVYTERGQLDKARGAAEKSIYEDI